MGRKPKHPDHKEQATILMNNLLDSLVSLWTSEEDPQLNKVSEELEMSDTGIGVPKAANVDINAIITGAGEALIAKMKAE